MSALAAVLAGWTSPGVYRWEEHVDVADVRHTVEVAGWELGYVDGAAVESQDELLAAVAGALAFPDHFGGNLDALADCLRDVPTAERVGLVLLWDGWSRFARADPRRFGVLLQVLAGRVEDQRLRPFVVLLRGEGPPVDIPLLD